MTDSELKAYAKGASDALVKLSNIALRMRGGDCRSVVDSFERAITHKARRGKIKSSFVDDTMDEVLCSLLVGAREWEET